MLFKEALLEVEDVKAFKSGDKGMFSGYASLFDKNPDSYGDVIKQGAFGESLKSGGRHGNGVWPILWQHKADSPIGVFTELAENSKGLKVVGQLAVDTDEEKGIQKANEAYKLLRMSKGILHMSIGFDLPRDKEGKYDQDAFEVDEKKKIRTLKKIDLWETSLVTFPAKVGASITNVKGLIKEAKTERELEDALRESGLSKSEAQYIVSLCRPSLRDVENMDEKEKKEKEMLEQISKALKETKTIFQRR